MAIIIFPEYMKLFISQQNLAKGKTNRSNSLAVCPEFRFRKNTNRTLTLSIIANKTSNPFLSVLRQFCWRKINFGSGVDAPSTVEIHNLCAYFVN